VFVVGEVHHDALVAGVLDGWASALVRFGHALRIAATLNVARKGGYALR
jgi:hypothetical protein